MQRSIAARSAGRPPVHYPTSAGGARGPRLGLLRHARFRAAPQSLTLLRQADVGSVALLRGDWRTAMPVRHHDPAGGPIALVRWAKLGTRSAGRRPRAASAPWRG